jgi:aspartate/methionine/tyrosine aminotransferase
VTPGATYGVTVTLGVLINPGDEVLVPDPGYPNFASAARMYGGIVRYYTLEERGGFQIDFGHLSSLVSSKTKVIIINSPSNPTGSVLNREQINKLVAFTRDRGIWLVSDEVYEYFVFCGHHVSPLQFEACEHVIGIFSLSKSYNITGLRIGYTVATSSVLCDGLLKAQELYISSAPAISQMAAIYALESGASAVETLFREFKEKKDLAVAELRGLLEYEPQGAFYILINIARSGMTSNEFADRLLEREKVAVAPGLAFGPSCDSYIRIALTPDPEKLIEGIRRIKRMLNA